ncbi:MAG: DoxX family protein [Acidimicrobiia bacterium]|nr:DoxX family protein [Acidimicrobiia bacterium]MBT8215106.1 DoxX family protein [Acidimicrobiia bacterium]NNK91813.1 DoxX family protein [Acidimicrobiia bacterium]
MDSVDAAMAVLRIGLGGVFLAHGIKHLGSREKTTRWFESIGFRSAGMQWLAMTTTEVGVGILLLAGLLTGLAAAAVVATMLVAYVTVHRKAGFWITAFMRDDSDVEGYEYVVFLAIAAVGLALGGPGELSLDQALGIAEDLDGWVGLALVGGATMAAVGQLAMFWRPPRG